jgi:hypothetical protein
MRQKPQGAPVPVSTINMCKNVEKIQQKTAKICLKCTRLSSDKIRLGERHTKSMNSSFGLPCECGGDSGGGRSSRVMREPAG